MDFRTTPLAELAESVRTRQVSARELTTHALERIEALNPLYNAFVAVDGERALAEAAAVDERTAKGGHPGPLAGMPLAGIPLAVKDNHDAIGFRSTFGAPPLADAPLATADSPFVARLRAAGCVVVGKTNLPEFAWTGNTTNALFGPTTNPFNPAHGAGGSSGGAAAAVAAGMVPLATGSDGGGSIRIPSSCCGISGMKPSLGRIPGGGPNPPGWLDLSTNGPMAGRISDIVCALDVAIGPDPTDLRSLPRPEASWTATLDDPHVPAHVAWSPTLGYAEPDAEVLAICQRAVEVLASLGSEVTEVDSVFDTDPVGDFITLTGVCHLRTMQPLMAHPRWDEIDPVLRAVVDAARSTTGEELVQVFDRFHRMNLALVELFHGARILVTPTCAGVAPLAGEGMSMVNGTLTPNWVQYTYPFNMTRSPAATVCAGRTSAGLPVGLQLIGPQHADLVVLRTAAALEAALREARGFDLLAALPV
jgi:Asp-tRNA(Asn)/Glu-tRNA(Gln) amidotransferase A subunit family amidase